MRFGRLAGISACMSVRHFSNTHCSRRIAMIGTMALGHSHALNLPRKRSADFHTSFAMLSSLGLLRRPRSMSLELIDL
jgi:hypothetical protein